MCQDESAWGWLVQLSSQPDTRLHSLTRDQHRVGRDSLHCSIVLGAREAEEAEKSFGGGDPNIFSRQHFAVSKTLGEEVAVLEDLGSRNGTWVNGVNVGVGRKIVLQHCSNISLLGPEYHLFQYLDRTSLEGLYSRLISSKYLVSDLLGKGTTAEVRRAYKYHSGSNTTSSVALKMIKTKNWSSQYTKPKYIEAEVDIQRSLQHPCIVKIQDVIKTEDKITLVMEHVKGGDLFEVLFTKKPVRRRTEYEVKILFYQLAHCIRYLHRNKIAHRDLKLENILVSSSSPFGRIKVSDFGKAIEWLLADLASLCSGLSKVWSRESPLKTYVGTPAYMAPEIARQEDSKKNEV